MKTLKHNSQSIVAFVAEKTVYLANSKTNKIYKQFGVSTFNDSEWSEIESISDEQFEALKSDFLHFDEEKKASKQLAAEQARIAAYESRKQEIINLWNWRKGRIGAFRIYTCNQSVELFNKNPNIEGSWEDVFFGTEEEAEKEVKSMIGSWTPEFNDSQNNVQGEIRLYECSIDLDERFEITSISELEAWFEEFNEDPIQDEWFAQPLPEKCIIVEMDEHRGSFNRKYYTPRYIYVEGDSLGSYTIGYRTINDYSALWGHVVFDTIDEYIEKYCIH